ncbi:MAG: DUF6531 domain-containing protein [Rhodospirillales bacterium]|nr:DUF6531 domain-containing protein [Rhodospirillales bacterium]
MIELHRKLLQQNAALNPGNPAAEAVLGEGLAMIGYTWLAEVTRVEQRVTELAGVTTTWLHAVGIVGMKKIGISQGPYVDLPLNTISTVQRVDHPITPPNTLTPTPAETSAFTADSMMSSVLESGSIEQTQPKATAVSTVKLLDLQSQSGPIFDINDAAISGDNCSYYASTIRPQLVPPTGNWDSADLARVDSLVGYTPSSGCSGIASTTRVVAPANGAMTVSSSTGSWSGTGYMQILYDPTQSYVTGIGQIITGGLSGGEPASAVPPSEINDNQAGFVQNSQYIPPSQYASSVTSTTNTNIAAAGGGSALTQQIGGDPVDLVTGSYTYNHQDMSIGSGVYPSTLPLIRYFDSALAQSGGNSSLLGNGWMHNYDMTSLPDSDGFEGLGDNSPVSGAAGIAALYVLDDILNLQTSTLKPTERLIIAAQISVWLMQQMTNNIATVTQPGSIERFVQLPDGSYNPPIGSSDALSGSAATGYTYESGKGLTLIFNPATATASGKITSWADAAGATVAFNYNSLGQLQAVCEPNCLSPHRQLNFFYTYNPTLALYQLTSVNDNTGSSPRTVTYGYDSSNDLTSVTDPLGYQTRFVYGATGQLTQIFYPTHPTQPFVSMTYDTLGRPNQQWDANGNLTTLRIAGSRTEIDDPVGTARVSYFTPRGKTLATIDGLGSATINGGAGNLTTWTYDGLDRVVTQTLPAGNGLSYTYDAYSNPLTVTQTPVSGSGLSPLTTTFTYVSPVAGMPNFEEVQNATDPLGLVTTYSYDTRGNRLSMVADAGTGHFNATTAFTYDQQGRVLSTTNPIGTVTANAYDAAGDLISTIAGYGLECGSGPTWHICQTIRFAYDAVGNVVATIDPRGNVTTSTYDADRRVTSTTLPSAPTALTTTTTYDPDGRVLRIQQSAAGTVLRTTSTTYTLAGKIATSTDANGNTTTYTYDADERLVSRTDPMGRTTTYTYDALSRPYQTLNLAVQSQPLVQYAYTPNGHLASVTDGHAPSGNVTTFAYDGLDRLATTTYPDGSTESLTYDANNNVLTKTTRAGATITYQYDTLNRLHTKTFPAGSTEAPVTYTYDLAGHLTGVSDTGAAIAVPATPATYATNTSYDALNRPIKVTWNPAPSQAPVTYSTASFAFGYDASNRQTSGTATDNSWWSYPSTTPTSVSYAANNLNQYSTVGSVSPTYDQNGDLTYDGSFTYCYDTESHLTGILTSGSCASPGTTVATYAYDGQGRRKSGTVGGTTTIYVTDADNRDVLEYDATSGALGRWYAYGQGPNEVLSQMNVAAGTRETLIPDIQGSMVGMLDSGTGTLTKAGYQPYGESASLVGTFRFTGQRLDRETGGSTAQPSGLYYYRARMYSPAWGRFLQPDPLSFGGGLNLYAYVGNDPINNIDPSGLWGFGLQGSASVEGGVLAAGAGATGSVGGGVFGGGPQGLNVGAYASGGAVAGGPGYGVSYPGVRPGGTTAVAGAAAGGGAGIFFTNATSAAGLSGPFNTYSLNTPIGSIQFGKSGSTWIVSVTCGVPPCGIGTPTVAASTYPTNTVPTPPVSIPSLTPPAAAAEPSTGFSSFFGGSNSPSK